MKLSIYVLAAAMLMAPTFSQNVDAKKKKKVNLKAITANKADAPDFVNAPPKLKMVF